MKHSTGERDTLYTANGDASMVNDMQQELKFAHDELLRMEDESGIALTKKQSDKVSAYSRASRYIQKIMFFIGCSAPRA